MFLTLNDRVLADLHFLGTLSPEFLNEFCKICVEFVDNGSKKHMFARAAGAMGVEPEVVSGGVMALTDVLLEGAKHNLSEFEFHGSLADVDMPEGSRKQITEFYLSSLKRLRARLHADSGIVQEYKHLDWRLDVEVGCRHAHDKMEPSFLFRLDTVGKAPQAYHFTSDFATLKLLAESLDRATGELKTAHSKRVLRYIH